jgi:hypothetical protein
MMFLWPIKSKKSIDPQADKLLTQRRNILFSRFTFFGILVMVLHVTQDGVQGATTGLILDTTIGFILLAFHLLHKRGYEMFSKIGLLIFLNLTLAAYCSVVPKYNGVFLFYFPIIGLSSVVFDYKHRNLGFFFVALSAVLLCSLVLSDFRMFGNVMIKAVPEKTSFLINLASSSMILMVCINFMMRYNDESETRLVGMAEEVRRQNKRLEKTNAELDRFVYSASHDLRAPLLSIQGIVNLAQYENGNQNVAEYLQMIGSQVSKLDSFIRDIINYSHNSRTEVTEQPVNFNEIVDCVRDNLAFMNGVERIKWEAEIDNGVEWVTDRARIVTVMKNLVSNAIKFHNLSREEPWIKIAVKRNCMGCCITVKDNGCGIPLEHQQRVFEMFYRAHDNASGSGLGLYIVREIVLKMNGNIHLQSQVGQGSTFTITLPMMAA